MIINMEYHVCIIGETQSGKTELANTLFQDTGGLYIDVEDKGQVEVDVTISAKNSVATIKKALTEKRRIGYVPLVTNDKKLRKKEVKALWHILINLNKNIYVYVDEAQYWGNSRNNDFDEYAIRGLKHGVHLVVMTQRPAKISKTIASQSRTLVCFDISGYERKYFKEYQLPYEEIATKLLKQPPYYFVQYVRKVGVTGPFKLTGIK